MISTVCISLGGTLADRVWVQQIDAVVNGILLLMMFRFSKRIYKRCCYCLEIILWQEETQMDFKMSKIRSQTSVTRSIDSPVSETTLE